MTPKEKAQELVNKYSTYVVMWAGGIEVTGENVKQCALIAVDEMIQATNMYQFRMDGMPSRIVAHPYWQEVKQEIEKL